MANLAEIKEQLGISSFNLDLSTDKDGNVTEWYRHWDNVSRVSVSLHKDSLALIQENPDTTNIVVQTETKSAAKGTYVSHRLVTPKASAVIL